MCSLKNGFAYVVKFESGYYFKYYLNTNNIPANGLYEVAVIDAGARVKDKNGTEYILDGNSTGPTLFCRRDDGVICLIDYRELEFVRFSDGTCNHDWEIKSLFTGTYKKCKRCGVEE